MTAIINALRDALQTAIQTTGLNAYDTWQDRPNPPCCFVKPRDADFNQTFGAGNQTAYRFEATVLVSLAAGGPRAQDALDEYLAPTGSSSIRAAVQSDVTLGGLCSLAVVTGWRDYGGKRLAESDVEYLGCVLDISIDVGP